MKSPLGEHIDFLIDMRKAVCLKTHSTDLRLLGVNFGEINPFKFHDRGLILRFHIISLLMEVMDTSDSLKTADEWELSKENVQPLKHGRKFANLSAALQPLPLDQAKFKEQKE